MTKYIRGTEREIKTLWQRSAFLTVFMMAVGTVYGTLLNAVVGLECVSFLFFRAVQLLQVFIALVGYVLSWLWVFMSRASKANQEIFEMRLSVFAEKFGFTATKFANHTNKQNSIDETGVEPTILGEVKDVDAVHEFLGWSRPTNHKLRSLSSGAFSVSKINVIIGYIFMSAWSLTYWFHFLMFCMTWCSMIGGTALSLQNYMVWLDSIFINCQKGCWLLVLFFIVLLCLFCGLPCRVGKLVKSEYLAHAEKKEEQ